MKDIDRQTKEAIGHLNGRRFEEAATAYRALLDCDEFNANNWLNFAFALHQLRRFEEVVEALGKAIYHGAAEPENIRIHRSRILAHQLGQPGKARAELETILADTPDHVPALLDLGGILEQLGDRAAARTTYERVHELEPNNIFALARLSFFADIDDADHPIIEQMKALIAHPRTTSQAKAILGFALGKALDSLGHYDDAFAAFRIGNEAVRVDQANSRYNPVLEADYTDRLIAAFPGRASEPSGDAEQPIFVCGMFRSGSTLAERILSRHSRVEAGGELELVLEIVEKGFERYPEDAARLDNGEAAELRERYLAGLTKIRPDADFVTDKLPFNFRHIGLIMRMFPDARIIDTLRNPLDNGLAMYFAEFGPGVPFATSLDDIVHFYRDYRRLMAHWQALYPDRIYTLDYDALVDDPEPHIRALIDFCGLEWEDACLEPHKADTVVRTASAWQVRQPLYKSSSGRWRNYEAHIGPLIEAFGTD